MEPPPLTPGLAVPFPVFPRRGRRVHAGRPCDCSRFLSEGTHFLTEVADPVSQFVVLLFSGDLVEEGTGLTKQCKRYT